MKSKIIINDEDMTRKFKTEQEVYLTSTWFKYNYYDGKLYNPDDVRVNGLNQYFIELQDESRVYFKDIKVFEFKENKRGGV